MVVHRDDLGGSNDPDAIASSAASAKNLRGGGFVRPARCVDITTSGIPVGAGGRTTLRGNSTGRDAGSARTRSGGNSRSIGRTAQRVARRTRGVRGGTRELGLETHGITDQGDIEGVNGRGAQGTSDLGNRRAIAAHCVDYDSHALADGAAGKNYSSADFFAITVSPLYTPQAMHTR
jgi:hypothetical protein